MLALLSRGALALAARLQRLEQRQPSFQHAKFQRHWHARHLAVGGDLHGAPRRQARMLDGQPLEREGNHVRRFAQASQGAAQQQAQHAQLADPARRDRRQFPILDRLGQRLHADLLHLQAVVADEQRGGAELAHDALGLERDAQGPVPAQCGLQGRQDRDDAAAPVLALVLLARLQQRRIQAYAGVHQEDAVVDHSDLHRLHGRGEERTHRFGQVFRDAVGAAEIIEGALGQHAEHAALQHGLVGDGIDGAVAAGGHQHAVAALGFLRHAARDLAELGGVLDDLEVASAAGLGQHLADGRAAQLGLGMAGAGVEHHVEGSVLVWLDVRHRGEAFEMGRKVFLILPPHGRPSVLHRTETERSERAPSLSGRRLGLPASYRVDTGVHPGKAASGLGPRMSLYSSAVGQWSGSCSN